jgi:hypothetical protein
MADKTSTGLATVNAAYTVVSGPAATASATASANVAAPVTTASSRRCARLPAIPGLALGQR